jgi:hypothetical protein
VRICFALVLPLIFAACAVPPTERWTRSGTDDATATKDMSECRDIAQQQAVRRYPYGFSGPSMSASGTVLSQQSDETNRSIAAKGLYDDCMEKRGYARAAAKQPGT